MFNAKPWYFSKTIWASLVAISAGIASPFGVDIDQVLQTSISENILQLISAGSSIFAIFGRISARMTIS